MLTLSFVSIFPEIFEEILNLGVVGKAYRQRLFNIRCYNPRDDAVDKHRSVDDTPYGGGAGMVMRADILERALLRCFKDLSLDPNQYDRSETRVILLSASGAKFSQVTANEYSKLKNLIFICGRYEGIDQRFIDQYADQELSVGDYVLSGGEMPALIVSDAVVRLLPGVLGSADSLTEESFSIINGDGYLLEYPHYTRPASFNGATIPEVLVSGNHQQIADWRKQESLKKTDKRKI